MHKKKDYNYLDKSFEDEKIDVENRFEKTLDLVYGEKSKEAKVKSKAIRVSVSLPEDDVNFVSYLRGFVNDPNEKFYPTTSDIYRAAIASLRKLEKDDEGTARKEIIKLVKGIY